MTIKTDLGYIEITTEVLAGIAGYAASLCFGVKGMAVRSVTDGLVHLLRREAMGKGVLVTYNEDESVTIDLHVVMDHGINIAAVCPAIINEVSYVVSKTTGVPVKTVNVYIDSISVD